MEQQAVALKTALSSPGVSPEQKLSLLNSIKSDIKHYRVPASCQRIVFDCLYIAISQQQYNSLVTAAFATLGHLIKRLKIQDPDGKAIADLAPTLLPVLVDRLRDSLDVHKIGASQAMSEMWPYCPAHVERTVREDAIGSTNPRAKEAGMQWVVKMHEEAGLHVKPFASALVACLEHSDGGVRQEAKTSIVALFRGAVTVAKNDLARQLDLHGVRQSIASQILVQIGHAPPSETPATTLQNKDLDFGASTRSLADPPSPFRESVSDSSRPAPPSQDEANISPAFVHSSRELEDMCKAMEPAFEGRESEDNWLQRDRHVTKLRCLTRGNAPSDHHDTYMAALRSLLEGILKAANSLRTTMATNGCMLVQDLARTLGPALDPLVEKLLPSFIKASSATKTIFATQSANTADTIFQYVSYNIRLLQHIALATQDKNKQTRGFATGWLRTLINRHEGSRSAFEHSGGLEMTEKCIKQGFVDADPKVKEGTRATYWAYARVWPEKAKTMMNTLDNKVRAALERDSHNPNAVTPNFAASVNARPSGTKSSLLREQIREQRAKAKSGNLPPRPVTAAANPTPARIRSIPNLNGRAQLTSAPQGPVRVPSNLSVSSAATDKSSSLSSSTTTRSALTGAVRRPVKRPELARPATADPYASRRLPRSETFADASTPKRNSPRATGPTLSSIRAQRSVSPAVSPQRSVTSIRTRPKSHYDDPDGSDSPDPDPQALENMTLVLPSIASTAMSATASSARKQRPGIEKGLSIDGEVHMAGGRQSPIRTLSPYRQSSPTTSRSSRRGSEEPERSSSRPSPQSVSRRPASPARMDRRSPSPGAFGSSFRQAASKNASPVANGAAPEIVRQGSPLKMVTATAPSPVIGGPEENVKIYEDPFHGETHGESNASTNNAIDVAEPKQQEITSTAAEVLVELPVNESNSRSLNDSPPESTSASPSNPPKQQIVIQSPDPGQASPPLSPQSKAEKLRSRKLIQSGIERLRARTLDTHGFRKVQELMRTNTPNDLFGSDSRRFEEFMGALCEYIGTTSSAASTPSKPGDASAGHELKRQALNVVRSVLGNEHAMYRKWVRTGSWNVRFLTTTLEARSAIEGVPIVVKDLEGLAQAAASSCPANEVLEHIARFLDAQTSSSANGVLDDSPARRDDPNHMTPYDISASKAQGHAIALALRTLDQVVRAHGHDLAATDQQRALRLLAPRLQSPEAEVRKVSVELATSLHERWADVASTSDQTHNGEPSLDESTIDEQDTRQTAQKGLDKTSFWSVLESVPGGLADGSRNLIVYYIARNP